MANGKFTIKDGVLTKICKTYDHEIRERFFDLHWKQGKELVRHFLKHDDDKSPEKYLQIHTLDKGNIEGYIETAKQYNNFKCLAVLEKLKILRVLQINR